MGETGSKALNQSSTDIGMFTEIKAEHSTRPSPLSLPPPHQIGRLVNRVFLLIGPLPMGKKYKAGSGDLLESTFLVLHLGQNPLLSQSWLHGVRGDLGEAAWEGYLEFSLTGLGL